MVIKLRHHCKFVMIDLKLLKCYLLKVFMNKKILSCLFVLGGMVITSCEKEKPPKIDSIPKLEKSPEMPPELSNKVTVDTVLSSTELSSSSQVSLSTDDDSTKLLNQIVDEMQKVDTLKLSVSNELIETMSMSDLWALYRSSRSIGKALEGTSEHSKASDAFVKAAEVVVKLKRPSIASWQYNSAAKNLLDAFSKKCDYYSSVESLNSMKSGNAKNAQRAKLKSCFSENFDLLKKASVYLTQAELLDLEVPEKGRDGIIARNKQFVVFVSQFIR
jgi:hypothetical protein